MTDCIFCKLASGEIPTTVVYQDDQVFAFNDMDPQAPVHILLIPKKHIASISELTEEDAALMGHMMLVAKKLAADAGIAEGGFRCVMNTGEDGGQSVKHLHMHILGGKAMGWPPYAA